MALEIPPEELFGLDEENVTLVATINLTLQLLELVIHP